ncbi:MAG: hypothetical protein FJ297_18760 [Planctomycetes bacterium]|nr:hypothetical protein [Planctomycetota bacterium]
MIAEFAFTPSVFDEQANPDGESWRKQLHKLGMTMFPMTAACPVMVADLRDGSWIYAASVRARNVADGTSKALCEELLTKIRDTRVRRPQAVDEWQDDDVSWCREAIASHSIEPIDRIVSCGAVQDMLAAEGHPIRCISEVEGKGFWHDISSQWGQQLTIPTQIQAIRKLTLHAEFLCLITPHVRGEGDDETEFAVKLILSSLNRPQGFRNVEIEVHSQGPGEPDGTDYKERLARFVENVKTRLRKGLGKGGSVRLLLWPKLLDRYLIAGVYTESSRNVRQRSPRWGLSMPHIARPSDARNAEPSKTPWSLLTREQLGDVFDRYSTGDPVEVMVTSQ